MLANSMEPDCQEKFMCLVIAISWTLTIDQVHVTALNYIEKSMSAQQQMFN